MFGKRNKKNSVPSVSPLDARCGNFYIHLEDDHHVKVGDVSGMNSVRVATTVVGGSMLKELHAGIRRGEDEKVQFARSYASVLWNLLCAVPDARLMVDVDAAVRRCVERHKDLYGVKDNPDPEMDAQVLREERESAEELDKIQRC